MKKPVPPCKLCDHRVIEDPDQGTKDCHDRCDEYMTFRKALDTYNKEVARIKGETKVPERRPWMAKFQKRNGEGGEQG